MRICTLLALTLACSPTAQPLDPQSPDAGPSADGALLPVIPDSAPASSADTAPLSLSPDLARSFDLAVPAPDSAPSLARDSAPPLTPDAAPLPPGDCVSPSMCQALMLEYERQVAKSATCKLGNDAACSVKAPNTLRCGSCETWVTERGELDMLRARFLAGGCGRCPGSDYAADGSCRSGTVCIPLQPPVCQPAAGIGGPPAVNGSCTSGGLRICPPGLMTGTPCSAALDHCVGGAHTVCTCTQGNPSWSCL